jgi:putative membrane protein
LPRKQSLIWLILATSLLYELFEYGLTLTLAPEMADSYNGQQGDIWDAHKDMALATIGALMAAVAVRLRKTLNKVAGPV